MTTIEGNNQNDTNKTINDLCTLVEHLSVHQRLLAGKIEELFSHHEQIFTQQNRIYSQIDALFSIFSLIQVRYPLPTMRGWPVSPDFVKILISLMLELKPASVVELGSGVSTIVGAYCIEKNGIGELVSIDHDIDFSQVTLRNLELHGLGSLAKVHCCPLEKQVFSGQDHLWYKSNMDFLPSSIDLLVVDGPPAALDNNIRYLSVPFFFERLSPGAVVLLDDAIRPGEKEIVKRWMDEYPCFDEEYVDTEKGAVILRRK
ncbi:MAG: class I SAM-dependent methyltransferase [Desulfobacteraceae bacterium]|jgi:predicted O-methyltransferase YrrM